MKTRKIGKIDKHHPLVKRFEKFFLGLEPKDRVAILHHTDPDGVCSGVIMAKLVEKARGKPIDFRINQRGGDLAITDETVAALRKKGINRLITTDLVVDQNPENVRRISRFAEILIIDHHKVYHDLNSNRITFIKPQLLFGEIDTTVYCAAKFCYDLGMTVADLSGYDWISAAGTIGDISYPYWPGFMKGVYKKYRIRYKKDPFKSELGKVPILISETECYSWKKIGEVFRTLYKSKDYRQFIRSKLKGYQKKVRGETDYYVKNFKRLAKFYPKKQMAILDVKSRFYIKSNISTRLALLNNHTTIITCQRLGDFIGISARREDRKVKVNELLVRAVKNLKSASGGGHIPAAAGRIRCKDKTKFISNLLEA